MAENRRRTGSLYEDRAAAYLESIGYETAARNYRTRYGEIDIISRDGDTLVFTEVKYRRDSRYGTAAEAVDRRKQMQIRRIAAQYLQKITEDGTGGGTRHIRFDVVAITGETLEHIRAAF